MRPGPGGATDIWPAGWPLRHFTLGELSGLIDARPPRLVELSKYLIRDDLSIKDLAKALNALPEDCVRAFAGTTDIVGCSGFPWERYRDYLTIQVAQARFLECDLFRVLVGDPTLHIGVSEVARRLGQLCRDLAPIQACIEIHGGVESDLEVLAELLRLTPVMIVVDFANVYRAQLRIEDVLSLVPTERIAYFHQRNLPTIWIEHPETVTTEDKCQRRYPTKPFLWEPQEVQGAQALCDMLLQSS